MMPYAFLLFSSFFHALWNNLLRTYPKRSQLLFQAILWATTIAWAFVFYFKDFSYGQALPLTLFSGIIEGLYFITVTLALSQAPIAISYSIMRSLSMLMTWLLSYIVLRESLTFFGAIGVLFVLIGLLLPLIKEKRQKSLGNTKYFWSYICAFTILGYNFIYNRALQLGISPLLLFATSLLITLPFLYFVIPKNERKEMLNFKSKNNHYGSSILLGSVILLSFTTFLYGLKDTLPATAITFRNASIPFALIISNFFGEKLKPFDYWILIFILIGVSIVSAVSFF
jgi:drug/metabolite transporter (DMT)-like permease